MDKTAVENLNDILEALMHKKGNWNIKYFIPPTKPIKAVVRFAKKNSESTNHEDDVPFTKLMEKNDVSWKWNKRIEKIEKMQPDRRGYIIY